MCVCDMSEGGGPLNGTACEHPCSKSPCLTLWTPGPNPAPLKVYIPTPTCRPTSFVCKHHQSIYISCPLRPLKASTTNNSDGIYKRHDRHLGEWSKVWLTICVCTTVFMCACKTQLGFTVFHEHSLWMMQWDWTTQASKKGPLSHTHLCRTKIGSGFF